MRYKNATIENLSEQIKESIKVAIEKDKGVFFYGDTGTGKTYTLNSLAKGKAEVDNFVMLLSEFRDAMQKGFYFSNLKEYINQDYVFIDDIGAEKTSDFVIEFIYSLVNGRYENLKRTVFATNLTLEKFSERYGERILSRIAEMCVLVEIKGDDRRLL